MATTSINPVEDSTKRLQRSLDNLTRSVDQASNDAIDKATESLLKLVKSSDALGDKEKKKIKDIKSATAALEIMQKAAKKHAAYMQQVVGRMNPGKTRDAAEKAYKKQLDSLKSMSDELDKVTRDLSTMGSRFGKTLDEGRSKVADFVTRTATATFAMGKLKEGVDVLYKTGVKLANRGLLATMGQMTTSALALRMSTEEFIDLIDKNRETVQAFGGGSKGILAFTDAIDLASDGLEYMGKDGKKATALFMSSFMKTGGTVNEFTSNSKKLNDSFRTLQATVGTTVEEFADYIEEINSSQMIQAKTNLGDKIAAQQMRAEALARTEQYAALQLTTKQMVEMNKTMESMYSPNKNRQAEVIKQRQYGRIAISSTANEMRAAGQGGDADILEKGLQDGSVDAVLKGSKDPKYAGIYKALDKMRSFNTINRGGDDASLKNFLGVEMADKSGVLQQAQGIGSIYNKADIARGSNQGQKYADQKANAVQGSGGQFNPVTGAIEDTVMTKAWNATRIVVEQTSSIMNTAFTPAILGATAALAAMIGPARLLAAGGRAGGLAKGGMARAGAALAGIGGGSGLLAAGAAGAAGYYGTTGLMSLAGIDPGKLGAGLYNLTHKDELAPGFSGRGGGRKSASIMPKSAPMTPGANSGLLEQIAQGEGTSDADAKKHGFATGYDVTLGYGAYGKGDKPLSQMTVREVKRLQADMLRNPNNKMNSSAVGKYQIVGTTLRSLQQDMGFKDDDLFDSKMQDSMATQLLKRRGLDQYKTGSLSSTDFQGRLSKEWASVANPNTGASYYGQATGSSTSAMQAAITGLNLPGMPTAPSSPAPGTPNTPAAIEIATLAEAQKQTQLIAQLVNQGRSKDAPGKVDKRTAAVQGG